MYTHVTKFMLQKIYSVTNSGIESHIIETEAALHNGLPSFHIVGLGSTTIQESKERIKSAVKQSDEIFPRKKIAVNLAPADIHKEGTCFDLPIALAILATSMAINNIPTDTIFLGELNFNGELRPIKGILPLIMHAKNKGFKYAIVPPENVNEARLVKGIQIKTAKNLYKIIQYLHGEKEIDSFPHLVPKYENQSDNYTDFCYIKGQMEAKRVLEISASGAHNVLFNGPPGSGKTLLSRSFPSILPPLLFEECLEVSKLYSIHGLLSNDNPLVRERPFRHPHHTASHISLVGGGRIPKPGEISLAHLGVLFLDEMAEFPLQSLESLRQPLEDREITVSRVGGSFTFPASFILIGAMNPCPCGYATDKERTCSCSPVQIQRYKKKLSGPLLDRIDLHLEIPRVSVEDLNQKEYGEKSDEIRKRVIAARQIQKERFKNVSYYTNSSIPASQIETFCKLSSKAETLLKKAANVFKISARNYFRIIKLGRTIADLCGNEIIEFEHVQEALQYRSKN